MEIMKYLIPQAEGQQPVIVTAGRVFYASLGERVVLPCTVQNKGSLVRLWKKGARLIFADEMRVRRDSRYSVTRQGDLVIAGFDRSDSGDYECELETDTDSPVFIRHSLEEAEAPTISLQPGSGHLVVMEVSVISVIY